MLTHVGNEFTYTHRLLFCYDVDKTALSELDEAETSTKYERLKDKDEATMVLINALEADGPAVNYKKKYQEVGTHKVLQR